MGAATAATSALRRSVGTAAATATSAGLAFAAIDYLGVVSILAYAPGATAALAIGIGLLLVLLVAGLFSELNGLFPTAAGIRLYLGRAVGDRTALAVTFTYMTTVVLVIAADAFLIGAAVSHVLHEPSALAYLWIAVLLGLATAANLAGVRLAGALQSVVTYTVLAGTAVLSVIALAHPGTPLSHPFSILGNEVGEGEGEHRGDDPDREGREEQRPRDHPRSPRLLGGRGDPLEGRVEEQREGDRLDP